MLPHRLACRASALLVCHDPGRVSQIGEALVKARLHSSGVPSFTPHLLPTAWALDEGTGYRW